MKAHHLHKHGHRPKSGSSPTYRSWISMRQRCLNENSDQYSNYGGRGIVICQEWLASFENFLADMGERPEGCTLDRIDPDGNYEPANCRWSGHRVQGRNKRGAAPIVFDGEEIFLVDLHERFGIPKTTLYRRYRQGLRGRDLVAPENRNALRTGERVASSKLTSDQVLSIVRMVSAGATHSEAAAAFDVGQPTVSDIMSGKTWSRVTGIGQCTCNKGGSMTETEKLQARLWNAVPDLPYPYRAKAESIASADDLTPKQRKAAWALLRKAEQLGRSGT